MTKRCSTRTGCRTPRANWWRQSMGIDWLSAGTDQDMTSYISTVPEILNAYITGQTMESKVLTCNYYYLDVDGTAQGLTTFQWVRADDATGTNKTNIVGATSSTYTLVSADNTKFVACEVTPVNSSAEVGEVFRTAYVGAVDAVFYPLDNFANVAFAFSLRKLAAAYAGNCFRIQATNGGVTQEIGFTASGDPDWAACAAFNAGGDVFMNFGHDQSGNGNNITFAAFSDQPKVNFIDKRIEWIVTNDGASVAHAASLNIGTGDFTFFLEGTSNQSGDTGFSFFNKRTSFAANNLDLQNSGGRITLMTGNGGTNFMNIETVPSDLRSLMCGYRNSTTKFFRINDYTTSVAESATDLTSSAAMNINAGGGGSGTFYMWSFILVKSNVGSDYAKTKKFLL